MRYDLISVRIACREIRRACEKARAAIARADVLIGATGARLRGEPASRLS